MQILLTGATGLVGRHILYELLSRIFAGGLKLKLAVLVRRRKDETAEQRLLALMASCKPAYLNAYSPAELLAAVECIDADVRDPHLREKVQHLVRQKRRLTVIHCAGSVNLFSDPGAEGEIHDNNYVGTRRLVEAFPQGGFKFVFVSTVFSCGVQWGSISDHYLETTRGVFRNPYERCKARSEEELDRYCSQRGIWLQILRPSLVCGRLLEAPLYVVPKFDVFYGWGKFFWQRLKSGKGQPVRVFMHPQSTMNIIPADYVAKAAVAALFQDLKEINIVNSLAVPSNNLAQLILDRMGYRGCEVVNCMPKNLNLSEKLYYRTVHQALGPYMVCNPQRFDATTVTRLLPHIPMPDVASQLPELIDFAIRNDFSNPEYGQEKTVSEVR